MSDITRLREDQREKIRQFEGLIAGEKRDLTPDERQLIASEITSFLADECEIAPQEIRNDSDLVYDLGVDSLTFLELFEELNSQYNLNLEIRSVARYARENPVQTVGELVDQICFFLEGKIELPSADELPDAPE